MLKQFFFFRDNFLEGSVSIEGQDQSILLQGHASLNRAVDGDTVAVEVFPKEKWTAPSGIVLEDEEEQDPGIECFLVFKEILGLINCMLF